MCEPRRTVSGMAERRRRRVVGGETETAGAATSVGTVTRPRVVDETAPWAADLDPAGGERGLRGLVGGGSSQITPAAAMRARDAARPTAEELARAESELHVVRRHWVPRD
jgi:hypothetical protein